MCAQLVTIVYQDGDGHRRKVTAILEDISPGGACIQLEQPIAPDTAVSILYPHGRYYGLVRHCEFLRTGYFVGIQFGPGYRWSRRRFTPEHLLQLDLHPEEPEEEE
jgi:hypothetical protein